MKILTYLATGVALGYGYLIFNNMHTLFFPISAGPHDVAYENLLRDGDPVDLYVYISTRRQWCTKFANDPTETAKSDACFLALQKSNLHYGFHNESLQEVCMACNIANL